MSTIPDDFHIILRKGGIFEGRTTTPSACQIITAKRATKSDVFTIYTEHRPHGTSRFLPATKQELKVADHVESIARLQELLCDLPTQFPRPGAEDLYGRDASIMQVTSPGAYMDFFRDQWEIPRPTEEQKVKFDEATAIVEKWGA